MPPAVIIAAIGLAISAIGTFQSFQAGKKASKRASEAARLTAEARKVEEKAANLRTLRAKRAVAREAQIKRADVTSAGVVQGAGGSSAVAGARASVSTQLGTTLSFLDTSLKFGIQSASLLGRAQAISNIPRDTTGQSLTAFGGTIFSESEKISKLFGN